MSKSGNCDQLTLVNFDQLNVESGDAEIQSRSSRPVTPTFSIGDILTPPFHTYPSVHLNVTNVPHAPSYTRTVPTETCNREDIPAKVIRSSQLDTLPQKHSITSSNPCPFNSDRQNVNMTASASRREPFATGNLLEINSTVLNGYSRIDPDGIAGDVHERRISKNPASLSLRKALSEKMSRLTRSEISHLSIDRTVIESDFIPTPRSTRESCEQTNLNLPIDTPVYLADQMLGDAPAKASFPVIAKGPEQAYPNLTMDILLDAARCMHIETQLDEAESLLDLLITKFAESRDLCTTWENVNDNNDTKDSQSVLRRFSPIYYLLLTLPESCIFPDLCQPTSTGRRLQDLCNRLASAIRRTKRKLRILQRTQTRQSKKSNRTTTCKPANPKKCGITSQNERRSAFLEELRDMWPGPQLQQHVCPTRDEETSIRSATPDPILSTPLPRLYTNPLECPLSMLSFVCNLNTAQSSPILPPSFSPPRRFLPVSPVLKGLHAQSPQPSTSIPKYDACPVELTIQVAAADGTMFSSTPSSWPSLADSRPVPSCESPSSPTFSPLYSSVSPSSCSTVSCGRRSSFSRGANGRVKRIRLVNLGTELVSKSGGRRLSDTQRSSRRPHQRRVAVDKPRSLPNSPTKSTTVIAASSVESSTQQHDEHGLRVSGDSYHRLPTTGMGSTNSNEYAPQLSPIPRERRWTELRVNTTEPHLPWTTKCGQFDSCSVPSVGPPTGMPSVTTTLPVASALCHGSSADIHRPTSSGTVGRSCRNSDPDDSGMFSSEDPSWTNTRPPTPDIRRSDLDLGDLSDGIRVLVIQETHLRAGTLYVNGSSSVPQTSPEHSRDQLFRIHLDAERSRSTSTNQPSLSVRRTSSPSHLSWDRGVLITSPKKRRQMDLLLYGWQVVQQAVLEVVPASMRHLPPGTRVCAAWSEQLASNLYPGFVAEDDDTQFPPNAVAVDFDDGDHRRVTLDRVRMLPDNFANLYELVRSSGTHELMGHIIPGVSSSRVCSTESDAGASEWRYVERAKARVRHNSAVDNPVALLDHTMGKRKWRSTSYMRKPSGQTSGSSSTVLSDMSDPGILTHTLGNRITVNSPHTVLLHHPSTSKYQVQHSATAFPTLAPTEPLALAIPHPINSGHLAEISYSTSAIEVTQTNHSVNRAMESHLLIDREFGFEAASTSTSGSDGATWHILEKFRRRKRGHTYCRSIVRDTDGLTVCLGNAVEFCSEQDEVYLGEVREIRWDEATNMATVIAAWFYHPSEAGLDGKRVLDIKGAVFATEHVDENEARCISRQAIVHPSYATFFKQFAVSLPVERNSVTEITHLDGRDDKKSQTDNHPDAFMTETNPNNFGAVPDLRSTSSSVDMTTEPVYFVAGKYDPVHKRVLTWDPDIATLIAQNM